MPRLPAKQREAEKLSTQLPGGSYAAAAHDAPSRNAFDAHANSLLSSLPGDKKKRKQALEEIISALKAKREEFRKEKKTGAGSATEAIDFYKYALDKNSTWKGENNNGAKNNSDLAGESQCHICNIAGDDLVHCSQETCQNAFHIDCIRPIPDGDIPEDWSCAFCDVNYVTGLKPQSRKRRDAVIAVKEMEELKMEHNTSIKRSNKRKMSDLDETPPSSLRSKRQRRSTTHSFEDNEFSSKSAADTEVPIMSKDEIPFEVLKRLSPKNINSNSKHKSFHCKFCMDDESLTACCFCACRVCFSKRDRTSTILCDICDAEYHMDCLSPPLLSLPSTDWFCPTCVNVIRSSQLGTGSKKGTTTPAKKSPGKVTKSTSKSAIKAKNSKVDRSLLKANYASKQPRLPCGRFAPKNFTPPPPPQPDQPVKRGPGRPPKNASKVQAPPPKSVIPSKTGSGRPRGRPPKIKKNQGNTKSGSQSTFSRVPTRGPGRPPKNALKVETEISPSPKPLIPKKPGTGRPRGRPPKIKRNQGNTASSEQSTTVQVDSSKQAKTEQPKPIIEGQMITRKSSQLKSKQVEATKAFVTDLEFKSNREESVSQEEMKQAEAAAAKAVASTITTQLEQPEPSNFEATLNHGPVTTTSASTSSRGEKLSATSQRVPRRKPGARECLQISRRFGVNIIPQQYMETLLDYCTRGKVEHLIRMRERLDEHSRFLELQLAGLELMIREKDGQEPSAENQKDNTIIIKTDDDSKAP